MAQKELVATGFLIFRRLQQEIQFLLLQTSYGEHHWTPPKGHVDPGETEMQTALRETREEAGLQQQQLNILDGFQKTLQYEVRGRPKRVVYWLAEVRDPLVHIQLSDEHIKYQWLELSEAQELAKYPDLQETLREALQYIKANL